MNPFSITQEHLPAWIELRLNDIDEIITLKDNIVKYLSMKLEAVHGDAFGCCSRYVECSDAKKCIHEDFLCPYAVNIESTFWTTEFFMGETE